MGVERGTRRQPGSGKKDIAHAVFVPLGNNCHNFFLRLQPPASSSALAYTPLCSPAAGRVRFPGGHPRRHRQTAWLTVAPAAARHRGAADTRATARPAPEPCRAPRAGTPASERVHRCISKTQSAMGFCSSHGYLCTQMPNTIALSYAYPMSQTRPDMAWRIAHCNQLACSCQANHRPTYPKGASSANKVTERQLLSLIRQTGLHRCVRGVAPIGWQLPSTAPSSGAAWLATTVNKQWVAHPHDWCIAWNTWNKATFSFHAPIFTR